MIYISFQLNIYKYTVKIITGKIYQKYKQYTVNDFNDLLQHTKVRDHFLLFRF
jgi:hypothetical protein